MDDFNLSPNIQRFLISTPSRILGGFQGECFNASVLFRSNFSGGSSIASMKEGHFSQNFIILSFRTDPVPIKIGVIPDYQETGAILTHLISVIFGKRMDFCGFLQQMGMFWLPETHSGPINFPDIPFNSHAPRDVELNLTSLSKFSPFNGDLKIEKVKHSLFFEACSFYNGALRKFESHPESAYADLVTAGEILTKDSEIQDSESYQIFFKKVENLEGFPVGEKEKEIWNEFKYSPKKIKKKFCDGIQEKIKKEFFEHEKGKYNSLTKENIGEKLRATYDLRSQYVHTGLMFDSNFERERMEGGDFHTVTTNITEKRIAKAWNNSLNFLGLERLIRHILKNEYTTLSFSKRI